MPQVSVTINGQAYPVACDPGQESRIRELAKLVDGKVAGFARQFAKAGEARLLVLAALMLADELSDAQAALLRQNAAPDPAAEDDPALAASLERLAARIEAVAAELGTPHI